MIVGQALRQGLDAEAEAVRVAVEGTDPYVVNTDTASRNQATIQVLT